MQQCEEVWLCLKKTRMADTGKYGKPPLLLILFVDNTDHIYYLLSLRGIIFSDIIILLATISHKVFMAR